MADFATSIWNPALVPVATPLAPAPLLLLPVGLVFAPAWLPFALVVAG